MSTASHPIPHADRQSRRLSPARLLVLIFAVSALLAPVAGVGATDEVTVEGEVILEHADDFVGGRSDEYRVLETSNGRYRLEGSRAEKAREGTRVRVRGKRQGETIVLAADSSVTTLSGSTSDGSATVVVAAASVTKRVAVLLINFTDPLPPPTASPTVDPSFSPGPDWTPSPSPSPTAPPPPPAQPWSKSTVRGIYFNNEKSVASYFAEVSNNKVAVTGEVFGWYTLATKTNSCNYSDWGTKARQAATAAGVNLSSYDHVVHAFPRVSACSWGGLAQVFGKYNWINGSMTPYVTIHELGHNLGAHHASTMSCTKSGSRVTLSSSCSVAEYGDPFDVMGQNASGGSHQRHLQTWHRKQVGFLSSADQLTVSKNGHYTVATAQVAGGTPRILRVPRPSAGDYFYLEFRQRYGLFDTWSTDSSVANGVLVRIAPSTSRVQSKLLDMNPSTTTFTDAALAVGKTFTDSANSVSLTTISISPTGAVLRIQVGPDTVAPTTPGNLKASAASSTSIKLSWTASTDDLGVTGYRIRRDGATIATVSASTLSYTDSKAIQGVTHSYSVAALDGTNTSSAATVALKLPDTTPPTAPTSVLATQTGPRKVTISWGAASDNGQVALYRVRRDGSLLTKVTGLSFEDTSVLEGRGYRYEVRAEDAAGNLGPIAAAQPSTITLTDVTPPSAPGKLTATAASSTSVKLTWTAASDNVGVTGYRVSRGGTQIATLGPSATSYTDSSLASGKYDYSVVAVDAAGNVGPAATASLSLVSTSSAPSVPGNLTATSLDNRYIQLNWTASSGGSGKITYRIMRNGVRIALGITGTSFRDRPSSTGTYTYKIRAVDASGNKSAFTPEVTAKAVTSVASALSAPTNFKGKSLDSRYIQLSWTASTGGSGKVTYRIMRNGVRIALGITKTSFTDRPPSTGTYEYKVRAVDGAGNKSPFSPTIKVKAVKYAQ